MGARLSPALATCSTSPPSQGAWQCGRLPGARGEGTDLDTGFLQSPTISHGHLRSRAWGITGTIHLQGARALEHRLAADILLLNWGWCPAGNMGYPLGNELVQIVFNHLLPLEATDPKDVTNKQRCKVTTPALRNHACSGPGSDIWLLHN